MGNFFHGTARETGFELVAAFGSLSEGPFKLALIGCWFLNAGDETAKLVRGRCGGISRRKL
jgi:hypothetical protein